MAGILTGCPLAVLRQICTGNPIFLESGQLSRPPKSQGDLGHCRAVQNTGRQRELWKMQFQTNSNPWQNSQEKWAVPAGAARCVRWHSVTGDLSLSALLLSHWKPRCLSQPLHKNSGQLSHPLEQLLFWALVSVGIVLIDYLWLIVPWHC